MSKFSDVRTYKTPQGHDCMHCGRSARVLATRGDRMVLTVWYCLPHAIHAGAVSHPTGHGSTSVVVVKKEITAIVRRKSTLNTRTYHYPSCTCGWELTASISHRQAITAIGDHLAETLKGGEDNA